MFPQRFLCYFSFYIKQSLNKANTNANLLAIWLISRVTVWPRMLFFLAINNLNFSICLTRYQVQGLSELGQTVGLLCKGQMPRSYAGLHLSDLAMAGIERHLRLWAWLTGSRVFSGLSRGHACKVGCAYVLNFNGTRKTVIKRMSGHYRILLMVFRQFSLCSPRNWHKTLRVTFPRPGLLQSFKIQHTNHLDFYNRLF